MWELFVYVMLVGMFSCWLFNKEIKEQMKNLALKWGQRLATSKAMFDVAHKISAQLNKPANMDGVGQLVDEGNYWKTIVYYGTLKFPIYIPKDSSMPKYSKLERPNVDNEISFYPYGFPIFWTPATVGCNITIAEGEDDEKVLTLEDGGGKKLIDM
jgi:hypothetical protein